MFSEIPDNFDISQNFEVSVKVSYDDGLSQRSNELFDKRNNADRNTLADSLKSEFGNTFVVLPNVLYGEWEGSLYDYKYDWSEEQKDSIRTSNIIGY